MEDDDPDRRPPSLLLPAARATTALTLLVGVAGTCAAGTLNDPTLLATATLVAWCVGHPVAAGLALLASREHGRRAVYWAVFSVLLLFLPCALVVGFLIWLSQQQLWTIG